MNERKIKGVVVDVGHGGSDPGAVSGNLREKDFNLKAAQYMYKRFQELGIPSVIVRDSDETINKTDRVNRVNNAFGGIDEDVIVLSNHINSGGAQADFVIMYNHS